MSWKIQGNVMNNKLKEILYRSFCEYDFPGDGYVEIKKLNNDNPGNIDIENALINMEILIKICVRFQVFHDVINMNSTDDLLRVKELLEIIKHENELHYE